MADSIELKKGYTLPWQIGLINQLNSLRKNSKLPHGIIINAAQSSNLEFFLWQLCTDLLCSNFQNNQHCGECQPCRLMKSNNFPDLMWLTREYSEKSKKLNRDINIEQIRKLIYLTTLTSQFDTLKIAVIYPAENLNLNAANALLKTLEEPEPNTLIILATHSIGRLPITIKSRCQVFHLPQASKQDCLTWGGSKGLSEELIHTFYRNGIVDPLLMLELMNADYIELQQEFFYKMLAVASKRTANAVEVAQDLSKLSISHCRLIIQNFIDQLIQFHIGINQQKIFFEFFQQADPIKAQALFLVRNKIHHQMQFEQNNLNVSLQLSDVLLSLKQLFNEK